MINWSLWFHHKMSLDVVESMMPWELNVYLKMTTDYIEAENERIASKK
jgi:hypothetical protein